MDNYKLTHHAIDRLIERGFNVLLDFPQLESLNKSNFLFKDFFNLIIKESYENKSIINNTAFMIRHYEKYGYDSDFTFYDNQKYMVSFVFTKKRSELIYKLVTVIPLHTKTKKFNCVISKQEIISNKILNWFEENIDSVEYLKQKENQIKHVNILFDLKKGNINLLENRAFIELNYKDEILKLELKKLLANNKATLIERYSKNKAKFSALLNGIEYKFIKQKQNIQIVNE